MRDLTRKQFADALTRHGMKLAGFLGYVELGIDPEVSVSRFNAGNNLRAQLAYLLAMKRKYGKEGSA